MQECLGTAAPHPGELSTCTRDTVEARARARDQRDGVGRERALAMKSYRVRNEGDPAGGSSTSRWFATQVDFRTLDDHIIRALGSSSILLCCGDGSELGIGYFWVGGGKFGLLLVST